MLPKPKVIFFDLDDTLISFDGVSKQAWEEACINFLQCTRLKLNCVDLLNSIQKARDWYWSDPERHKYGRSNLIAARRKIVSIALKNFDINDSSLSNMLADKYSICRDQLIHLFPNTVSTLERLKAIGIKLGLITNGTGKIQRRKINRFNLDKFFDHILIEDEFGFGKPDERIYMMALSLFDIMPQDTWIVGDNLVWEVQVPQSLGIYSIWHDYKKNGLSDKTIVKPDQTIYDISELLTLFQ